MSEPERVPIRCESNIVVARQELLQQAGLLGSGRPLRPREESLELRRGDLVVLATDGVRPGFARSVSLSGGSPQEIADGSLVCHPGPLSQVIMNLLSNAVQAIPEEGTITVTTSRPPGLFRLAVRDTGVGIPEDQAERIFEPFFTTRPVGSGTGLGLAITFQVVEAHRGTIRVRSAPGQGAEFTVEIPTDLARRLARKPGGLP